MPVASSPTHPRPSRLHGASRMALALLLTLAGASRAAPDAPERSLWEARTVLGAASKLLENGQDELASLVLRIGAERLDGDPPSNLTECRAAPSATGTLLVTAKTSLLLAYALERAQQRDRARGLLRAALRPLRSYARYDTSTRQADVRDLEQGIQSALEQEAGEGDAISADTIVDWWGRIEVWCHVPAPREPRR